jgi:NADH-quinone oxidoreductase subunit H
MAAYASRSKFTLIGGLRAVGQIIAYELPIVLGAVSVAMLAGSLSLTEIVEAQRLPFVIWPIPFGAIAFVLFVVSSFAEVMWNPFDMPVAESEIVTGPYTEYSGMRFIFFYISEFAHVVALAALATLLFLGGWNGPILPPIAWFFGKLTAFGVFFIWVRFTMPRLREDQLQKFAWKLLIPLGLVNVLGIALYKVLL